MTERDRNRGKEREDLGEEVEQNRRETGSAWGEIINSHSFIHTFSLPKNKT